MMRPALTLAALLVGATLAPAVVLAQAPPLSMPPPPSASDPAPKAERAAKPARKPAKAARKRSQDTTFAPSDRSTFSRSEMSDRIDTRGPPGRRMELEDDPRVQPTMQNGRAGVGMRF